MKRNHKIAIAAALALSVVAVGGAVGATKLTPRQQSQAVIDDAARQLGVEPEELGSALEQALKNRVDAAVEDGRLTEEQGERMKARIDSGKFPLFGLGPGLGLGHHRVFFHAKLDAAASYLGMSKADLRAALEDGKTMAQVARDRGKSVNGLVDALVERAEEKLAEDVERGRVTDAQRDEMLEGLRERVTSMVNGRFPMPRGPRFREFRRGAVFHADVF